jgi:Skp family chaperone for outer membrane proteins
VTTGTKGEAIGVIRVVAFESPAAWREEYHERIDRRIQEWGEEIEKLRGKAETLGAGARARLQAQADELKALQETAKKKLSRMRKAGGEAWGDLHAGAEQALEELRKGYEAAASKLKK